MNIERPKNTTAGATTVPTSVDLRGLTRVGAKPVFLDYLVALWDYRHFIYFNARASVQTSNSRDRLGNVWLILNPVLNGITFYLIFGVLLHVSRGMENFLGFLLIGVFLFQMSSRSISAGARAIRTNLKVIQAFNFPRAALLFAVNLRELLASVPVVISLLLLILLFPPTEPVSLLWLLVLPALLLQTLFNLGVGLILARVVARVSDVGNILSFAIRFWMYGSCVIFPITLFGAFPLLKGLIEINPLYQLLTIVRTAVLDNQFPQWQSWAVLTAWALGVLAVGLVYFWQGEESYGRDE
ncbi:ABC transporter permease [Arthrobacter crusticola]|uniref:Transport permease protein n=1 Tax=Arthrobacter crusticola TaxID=2547960 RepID=A0A4R5U292_9MICC|nr:ABC transporter permease [Arthrobacter crusticola]TDK27725.1 ABC transporter permease [Arthrobacter crusticola]